MSDVYEHRKLRDREQALSCDVAEAITNLASNHELPVAISKSDVVMELVRMTETQEDGTYAAFPKSAQSALIDKYKNRLENSGTFSAGYKRYEAESRHPVVPVSEYFFKVVWTGQNRVAQSLSSMVDTEIFNSLPKRPGKNWSDDQEDYIRDNEGKPITFGRVAGIVVFPPNYRSKLLETWLNKQIDSTNGSVRKTANKLEQANTKASVELRERVSSLKPAMRKALLRSR